MSSSERFWDLKSLDELNDQEWESLCDGCGLCCLHKLEDEDTGQVHYTNIACKLLDTNASRCSRYQDRFTHVPDCLSIRPLTEEKISWLPQSCAYVKLAKGENLAPWHPLISGNPDSVRAAGVGVSGRCVSENTVPLVEWPHHLIDWAD